MTVSQVIVAGRYRLRQSLGSGGMGRVWLARDEVLHRDVAVKEVVLPLGLSEAEREEFRQRTLREARAAARLSHPNVVQIYDVVQADNQPWIVMEYVRSRSLHRVINEDGPIEPDVAARIGLSVLAALNAAHRAGVLHRDVKPSHVLIADSGRGALTVRPIDHDRDADRARHRAHRPDEAGRPTQPRAHRVVAQKPAQPTRPGGCREGARYARRRACR